MALNFTVSYTFAPSTTISSSQVNTNTSDVANVFTGLEALTKTLAKLKMDVDPSTALEVATKQYVDHYANYRRPVLQFGTVSTVAVESGLDGTSGDVPIQFPDGSIRTETSTTRTTFNITRNAVLVTSGAQSGLTGATSEAANTWYALYAVKVTDSSTLWVTVGSTVFPTQANYATLNTAYGTSGWVYLGAVRNGDNSGATSDLLSFVQAGNTTILTNNATAAAIVNGFGLRLATTASATSLTYTYAAGTGTAQIPSNLTIVNYRVDTNTSNGLEVDDSGGNDWHFYIPTISAVGGAVNYWGAATSGVLATSTAGSNKYDIFLGGWIDGVLGVGSNPLL